MGCQIEFWKTGRKRKKTNKYFWRAAKKGNYFSVFSVNTIKFLAYIIFFFHHCIGNFLNTSLFIFEKFWIRLIFFTHLTFKSTASFFLFKVRIWKDIWRGKERKYFFFALKNFSDSEILKNQVDIHTSILECSIIVLHYFYMYLS